MSGVPVAPVGFPKREPGRPVPSVVTEHATAVLAAAAADEWWTARRLSVWHHRHGCRHRMPDGVPIWTADVVDPVWSFRWPDGSAVAFQSTGSTLHGMPRDDARTPFGRSTCSWCGDAVRRAEWAARTSVEVEL